MELQYWNLTLKPILYLPNHVFFSTEAPENEVYLTIEPI